MANLSTIADAAPLAPTLRALGALSDALFGARGCLFTFHRAAPSALWEKLPNREFYLDLDFLDRLLTYLEAQGWKIVTIEEALDRARANRRGDRFVNFSVDDCYRDSYEAVVPLFRRHAAPVTLFVTTGIPDDTMSLWHAGLEEILLTSDVVFLDGEGVDCATSEKKRALFAKLATSWDGPQARDRYEAFCAQNGFRPEDLYDKHAISWEMLEELRQDPFVELGTHTVNHLRISSLDEAQALDELAACRKRLKERLDVDARHFAFPYGRSGDAGARDFRLARRAGYASAATTGKGLLRSGCDPFRLPRNTLRGGARNLAMTEAHMIGLTGLAARLLGRG
jgi:peptidoglycan/xylan/chitin deacetylase (PgdA/CDA1 family)